MLLYRREAYAVFGAVYRFLEQFKDDSPRTIRTLPGVVRNDLLGVACLAPLLDYPLRASVEPVLHVSDASLDGAAAVEADIPATVARELWRHRIRAGTRAAALGTPGNRKGDSFVGEIVEGLPMRPRLQFIFRGAERKARNINAGEARGRKRSGAISRTMRRSTAADTSSSTTPQPPSAQLAKAAVRRWR